MDATLEASCVQMQWKQAQTAIKAGSHFELKSRW